MNRRKVLIVGAGGLGFSCAFALANHESLEADVTILDCDVIESSNLNRQLLFRENDIGASKAERLCSALSAERAAKNFAHQSSFLPVVDRISPENADHYLENVDLLIDCTDSVGTKLLLNDFAVRSEIAFIYGGAIREEGVALLRPRTGSACLRCLFGDFSASDLESYGASCSRAGILGPIAGMVGILQAAMATQWLRDSSGVEPALYQLDSSSPSARKVTPAADPECPLGCGRAPTAVLDLTAVQCPMTYLYTKLALEELKPGGRLTARFGDHSTAESVRNSAVEAGFAVESGPEPLANGEWALNFRGSTK